MQKIFDRLCFFAPIGLGDSFVVNGIVHWYADRCFELHVPVQPRFYKTLNTLYQDFPNIKVVSISNDVELDFYRKHNQLSSIQFSYLQKLNLRGVTLHPLWDLQHYSDHELPFHLRYTNFRLPKHINGSDELFDKLSNNEPYILVHRYTGEHPEGIPISIENFRSANGWPNHKIIDIDESLTDNMMHYVKLIQNAEEIHVVPSSFHCLVDSIETKAKLFLHDVREKTSMMLNSPYNNYKWCIVTYDNKW